jgi:lambda repressor-like predicted transcriptional regulator
MSTSTLSERVAEEIRVRLARRNISAAELARRTGLKQPYLSRRMTCEVVFDMRDLERIAAALDVDVAELLPARADRRSHNKTSSPPPVRPTGPRSTRALLAPGHAGGRHPTSRGASAMSGAEQAELRRPAITGRTHSGSST